LDEEKTRELLGKIQGLRMKKLLIIEYIADQCEKVVEKADSLFGKADEIRVKLLDGKIDAKTAMALLKSIDSENAVLNSKKAAFRECRLSIGNLGKEESRLEYELAKGEGED
jgi:hypothetical protein